MPEVNVEIGGRSFSVACQDGEEVYLRSAAKMLDTEASVILGQIGRMPADRMLLMAGLMLADKTAALEEDVAALKEKLAAQGDAVSPAGQNAAPGTGGLAEVQDAAPVVALTDEMLVGLTELTARAEALAADLESNAA